MKKFLPSELTVFTGRSWNLNEVPAKKLTLCFDSRHLSEDSLFWPLVGEKFDAHNFIEGLMKDHSFFAAEKDWMINKPELPGYFLELHDSNKDLGILASNFATSLKAKRIAITGSNGKTTTKEMVKCVLGDKAMATKGNLNNHLGVPFTLLELNEYHEYAVVEAGTNHPGEIDYLSQLIKPHVAVITNIGDSHLEFLIDRDGVFKEKQQLQNGLQENGLLIVCADDVYLKNMVPKPGINYTTYGIEHGHLRPQNLLWSDTGCAQFTIEQTTFELKAPGKHNLLNALCAISIAMFYDISLTTIANRLNNWTPGAMRSEFEQYLDFILYKDCYNSNPSSVKAALNVMSTRKNEGRKLAVIGDMFELGEQSLYLHKSLAEKIIETNLDVVFLTGEKCKALFEKLNGLGYQKAQYFETNSELGQSLIDQVQKNDIILFKASRGMKFDEIITQFKEGKA